MAGWAGLERQCNFEMMARMLLNGDFVFCLISTSYGWQNSTLNNPSAMSLSIMFKPHSAN